MWYDESTAETECCACEPGGLSSAFLRTSGFSLATTLDQLSIAATGRVVKPGRHPVSSLVHPKPSGLGAAMIGWL